MDRILAGDADAIIVWKVSRPATGPKPPRMSNCSWATTRTYSPRVRVVGLPGDVGGTALRRAKDRAVKEREIPIYPMSTIRKRGIEALTPEVLDRVWD
jgi:hypothetical protein